MYLLVLSDHFYTIMILVRLFEKSVNIFRSPFYRRQCRYPRPFVVYYVSCNSLANLEGGVPDPHLTNDHGPIMVLMSKTLKFCNCSFQAQRYQEHNMGQTEQLRGLIEGLKRLVPESLRNTIWIHHRYPINS